LSATSHSLTPQNDMDSSSSEEFYQAVHHAEQTFRKMESYLKQQQLCDVILIVGNRKIPAHRLSATSHSLTPQNDMDSSSSEEFYQAVHHAEQTFRKMESYLKQQQLCDVILIVGNRKIPAHRLVLSSVSDYFAAMFTSDVCEAKQEEIKMEGIDPNALWDLVQFAYTGCLELKEDTIENLLAAACLLQLPQVVEVCCHFLMKLLHPSNCLGIRAFADAQGCIELMKVAHSYTM
ncbi:PREDICTED: kelch-like protein 1, partial [Galeopterus variegatus]|uniref:Kelch-like protein 1 n=1 Tax=Galeopterus variegatus TaxID=482537 RepID=A0ABM0SAG6_GALVR